MCDQVGFEDIQRGTEVSPKDEEDAEENNYNLSSEKKGAEAVEVAWCALGDGR
jgi:hypothetical protein